MGVALDFPRVATSRNKLLGLFGHVQIRFVTPPLVVAPQNYIWKIYMNPL